MNEQPKEYTGTFIPAAVMLDEGLRPIEKMIYAEVASFRECFMTNEFLSKRIGVSVRSLQNSLSKLEKAGYIEISGGDSSRRVITTMQNLHPPMQNLHGNHAKSAPINNNIKNNLKKTSAKADLTPLFEDLVETLGFSVSRVKATPGRLSKLAVRKRSWSAEDMTRAARAIKASPWHQGVNPNKVVYGTIDFLLRSDEMIEKWMNMPVDNDKPGVAVIL